MGGIEGGGKGFEGERRSMPRSCIYLGLLVLERSRRKVVIGRAIGGGIEGKCDEQ